MHDVGIRAVIYQALKRWERLSSAHGRLERPEK